MASPVAEADELPGEGRRLVEAGVSITHDEIASGALPLVALRRQGLLVFSTPFNRYDGYGDGPSDARDPLSPGGRPTLQGNGTFLRVNGLDGQSCLECHSIVSNATVPPQLGLGGVGGSVSNALVRPTAIDVERADSGFDGRFINPLFLFGSGGVQLLANEMTQDLQAFVAQAEVQPGVAVPLRTHGIDFGSISFENGQLDVSRIEGIDADLVVRPFGRKGSFATVRAFDVDALRFHFGIEPVESVGAGFDADADGVADEIGVGAVSALEIFNTTLEPPERRVAEGAGLADVRAGERVFLALGCARCHVPEIETRDRWLGYRYPEVPEDPAANVYLRVDLSRAPMGFARTAQGGIRVPLFADLKRHDMGAELAEASGSELDPFFTTARLWGVADTAPYLHDGRATTLGDAIRLHGGEARDARDAYVAAPRAHQAQLLHFLRALRTPRRPAAGLTD
jgi:hypothetical protein